jgi:cell wall-associated NlpC family hydrolase
MKTISIDRSVLMAIIKATVGRVRYRWGAKPKLNISPEKVEESDCSGFVRYVLYMSTGGKVKLPLGSWCQRQWFISEGFEKVPYSHCSKVDSRLRVAFINPLKGKPGHVWLVASGRSIESCGGKGAVRRAWNTQILLKSDACFILGPMV